METKTQNPMLTGVIWVTFVYLEGNFGQVLTCYPISWVMITIFIAGYYPVKQKSILAKVR